MRRKYENRRNPTRRNDAYHSARPQGMVTLGNITRIREFLFGNRKIKLSELANFIGISKECEFLQMKKLFGH